MAWIIKQLSRRKAEDYFEPREIRPNGNLPRFEGTVECDGDTLYLYQHDPVNSKKDNYAPYPVKYKNRIKKDSSIPNDSPIRKDFDEGLPFQKYKWEDGIRKVDKESVVRGVYNMYGEGVYEVYWLGGNGDRHPSRTSLLSRTWISEVKLEDIK